MGLPKTALWLSKGVNNVSERRQTNQENEIDSCYVSHIHHFADCGSVVSETRRMYQMKCEAGALAKEFFMLSHVHVGVGDFERAMAFYRGLMEELGFILKFVEPDRPWAGWMQPGHDRPLFLIGRPYDDRPAAPGNGQMVALLASNRETVDRSYARAMAIGAKSEGAPALRPHYHAHYYGAYFRDPDGNKLCVCCHTAE